MKVSFSDLPENSKLWIYTADRELSNDEVNLVEKISNKFLGDWKSHGQNIQGSILIPYNHFIVICANQEDQNLSGCSIDDSVRFIKTIEEHLDISLLNRQIVSFKEGEDIKKINFNNIKSEVTAGNLKSNTIVFNTLINSKKDYVDKWETTASNSWLNKFITK